MVKAISLKLAEDTKALIDALADGLILIGMDGKIIAYNLTLEKMLGFQKSEIIEKSVDSLLLKMIKQEDLEKIQGLFITALKDKIARLATLTLISKDGREIPVAASGSFIKDINGEPIAITALIKDITEIKKTEDALRENENKYRTLVENLPQKIFLKDKNFVYISCNENCAKDIGIKPEQIIGKTDYDFFSKKLADKFRADDKRIMESDKIEEKETKHIQDGQEIWFQTVLTPIKDKGGNIVGILGIFWDITERKRMEKELNEYRVNLEELVKDRTSELKKANSILNAINKLFQESIKCESDEDVVRIGLNLAKELTNSNYGFIGELNPKGRLDAYMLGDSEIVDHGTAELKDLASFKDREMGVILGKVLKEGKSFILNDLDSHPESIKLPAGHLSLKSILAVPLKLAGKTIGMISLANKKLGYDLNDKNAIESLSLAFIEALTRKRIEQEIKHHREHLEEMVDEHLNTLKISYKQLQEEIFTHKKAETALKESEQRFKTLLDNASDGILVADPQNHKFYFGNKTISQMLGYNLKEIENLGLMDIHEQKDLPYVMNQFDKLTSKELTLAKNIPVKRKDGTIFFADINSSHIIMDGKKYIMGVFRDITERKEMEEKLHQLNEELEQRIKDKTLELKKAQEELIKKEKFDIVGKVIGEISRRLQDPLAGINDLVGQLKTKLEDSDEVVRKDFDKLLNGIAKANEALTELVNLSQIRVPILRENNINNIIKEALTNFKIPENIIVETKLDENLPNIELDPNQIQLAFKNIIFNALQAMQKGGKLEINSCLKENCIGVIIKDTGQGISEKNMDKIFDPLFSTKAKKIGLGLPIAKNIIDKHNGKIDVESKIGQGTIFSIELPILKERKME